MEPVLLVDAVGLTARQLGPDTPALAALAERGAVAPMSAVLPAVTCSAQATLLTGRLPQEHGAVGNGWRDPASWDVALWRQANANVSGEKLYETARRRDPTFTCAKLFWWFNMGAAVDWSITPRPHYPSDGRKVLDVYGWPYAFPKEVEADLGPFPFFDFWGPRSGVGSSRWIADATLRTLEHQRPTLTLCYLPHLDYDLQRYGPDHERSRQALRELDGLIADLVRGADRLGAEIVVVSEYGLGAVDRPIHINRALRSAGLLVARPGPAGEVLDVFASRAFALADHQVAHVYCKDERDRAHTREVVAALPGVEHIWSGPERADVGLDHPRAGDLVAATDARSWFTYYFWHEGGEEPDFARTVDIHRKPGYDPCELFVDPDLRFPTLRVAQRLAQKKLGFRYLMDVIPVAPELVRGSHGRLPDDPRDGPVFLCSRPFAACGGEPEDGVVRMESVRERVLGLLER